MATRDELVVALSARYALSNRMERGRILDEFVAVRGFIASTRCVCYALSTPGAGRILARRDDCIMTPFAKR
jgi:hypothetical protein